MSYQVLIMPSAQRDLELFKGKAFSGLCKIIRGLSENPRPAGSLKLTGEGGYRIRVGICRILYRIDDKDKKVFVYRVRHRRDVYK